MLAERKETVNVGRHINTWRQSWMNICEEEGKTVRKSTVINKWEEE
jgi:hypothetical protein